MKAVFKQSELATAVSTVQRAVSTKSSNPALEGILIKVSSSKATLCGYDLDIGITTDVPVTMVESGDIVLSARIFSEIVKRMPDELITIETDDKLLAYLNSGVADYQIVGISSYEYPELPTFEALQSFEIEAGTLKSMIRDTFYAISDNPSKPALMGSLFDVDGGYLNVVSIDGFRMSVRREKINCDDKFEFILPKKTLGELLKINCEDESIVTIAVGKKHAVFKIEGYSVVSRLIEGKYVSYKDTIPKGSATTLKVETRDIISSVERMSLLTSDKMQQPVHFVVADEGIKMFCTTAVGKASDYINLGFEGDDIEIGFNNRYLLDAVKNVDADELVFVFNGPNRPLKILPVDGDSFLVLVVPMRI